MEPKSHPKLENIAKHTITKIINKNHRTKLPKSCQKELNPTTLLIPKPHRTRLALIRAKLSLA
jgi:hypothetical protein